MTIDITPEAVQHPDGIEADLLRFWADKARTLSSALTDYQKGQSYRYIGKDGLPILARDLEDQRDAALAALTASQAETAAAYEVAAQKCIQRKAVWDRSPDHPYDKGYWAACDECTYAIRALTPADSKAALDRMVAGARADALSGPWKDKPDALTDAIDAAHPVYTKDYKTYTEALELVSARHSKGSLVGLVNYLLSHKKAIPKGTPHE